MSTLRKTMSVKAQIWSN